MAWIDRLTRSVGGGQAEQQLEIPFVDPRLQMAHASSQPASQFVGTWSVLPPFFIFLFHFQNELRNSTWGKIA